MIEFHDGPAFGQHLLLIRAPLFLRVVVDTARQWAGIENAGDVVQPHHAVFLYQLVDHLGCEYVRRSHEEGGNGWFENAIYRLPPKQPDDDTLRINKLFWMWCKQQPEAKEQSVS